MAVNEESVFAEAMEKHAPQERAAFLDHACAGNPGLRQSVESLLSAYDAGQFLEAPAPGLDATMDPTPLAERPGGEIGPYKLLEQVGEGGMGLVFMADQLRPVRRRVALKIIKPGMDSRQVIARFEAERQALAMMDHANIARVFDAGTTASGRPYFAMELVRGIPITDYCDEHKLAIHQRLELFVQVCQAVQHAHQKGVIHRDLKPSNVLVAHDDTVALPKIIDFGIAKATSQPLTERTLFTALAQVVGTPLYMSPEQAALNHLDVDTRSDVYSLGVLLYELLTGTTPFEQERLRQAGLDEVRRIIREEEPPRPSTRVSTLGAALTTVSQRRSVDPRRISVTLRGDLDWIVMKALEKDRQRRYESASAFAADVERYLNDEPVEACPPSAFYRLRKFTRRNRSALILAGTVLVCLVILAGSLGWILHDRASREGETERTVNAVLREAEQLQAARKAPEALAKVKQAATILATSGAGTVALQQRVQERLADLNLVADLEELRAQRAELRLIIANRRYSYPYAQADSNYEEAFRVFGVHVHAGSPDEAGQRLRARTVAVELAAILDDWAYVAKMARGADALRWKRLLAVARAADPERLRTEVREVLEADSVEALKTLAATIEAQKPPAATLAVIGTALVTKGAYDEAALLLGRAQRLFPTDFWINFSLAGTLAKRTPPQYEEAIRYYTAAVVLRPDFAVTHNALGSILGQAGRGEQGIAAYQEALRLKPDYVLAHTNLASTYRHLGRLDEAIAACQAARRIKQDDPWAFYELAQSLLDKGQLDDTIAVAEEAIRFHPDAARGYIYLSRVFLAKGQVEEAIAAAQKAVSVEPDHPDAHVDLGFALQTKGLFKEAIDEYRLSIRLKLDRPEDAYSYYRLAWALMTASDRRFRDTKEALEFAKEAVALQPRRTEYLTTLGVAYYRNGEWKAAIEMLNRSIKNSPTEEDSQLFFFLAMAHWQMGAKEEALSWHRRGVERMDSLKRNDAGLLSLRAEAEALLGLSANDPKNPAN